MKFEDVPIPVGSENIDPTLMVVGAGLAVAVLLVAIYSPRLFTLCTLAGLAAGVLLIGS